MPLFRTVDRLRDLRETVLDAAPAADATAALLRLGQPLIGGNAFGTILGGRQPNGYAGDYINWQGTDAGGVQRNRLSLSPTGAMVIGDIDCTATSILLKGNNTGNNIAQFGVSGGVPFLTLYEAGGGTTRTFGRTDVGGTPYSSFTMGQNGSGGWLFRGRGGGVLRLQDAAGLVDCAFFDDAGRAIIGGFTILASAALQVDSTTRGFLPPRMTTTQKNAIASPATGLLVQDSTLNKLCRYDGAVWRTLSET